MVTQKELLWKLGRGMTSRTDRCSCSGGCADAWRADGTRAGLGQILARTTTVDHTHNPFSEPLWTMTM